MATTTNHTDIHWNAIKFLQDAGAVYNLVHSYDIRSWGVKYSLWLRDRHLYNATNPAPVFEGAAEAKVSVDALRDSLNAIAGKHFPTVREILPLIYEYEWSSDEGIPPCPACGGMLSDMKQKADWLKCEECAVECNVVTGAVWSVN